MCGQRTHTVALSLVVQAIKLQAKLLNPDPGRQPKRAKVALYLCFGSFPICGGLDVAFPFRRQNQYNLLGRNCLKEQPFRQFIHAINASFLGIFCVLSPVLWHDGGLCLCMHVFRREEYIKRPRLLLLHLVSQKVE